jgi:dynein heavy chain
MREAKSNIDFLQILKDPCDELDKTVSPADIPKIIPTLLQNVIVIWINSPYYNTR